MRNRMKNGVFEPFCPTRRPSAAKKWVTKGPIFAHSTPFCAFYFENFAVFFTSERTPQRKKSTPNFSAALTFSSHRPPNFSVLAEKRCEPAIYEHPSKFAYFRSRTLFFRRPPVFWGVNRPIFWKLAQNCLQSETIFQAITECPQTMLSMSCQNISSPSLYDTFLLNYMKSFVFLQRFYYFCTQNAYQ